jgi:(p)ppGpp synthase/HD superfamily hydrolase
MDILRKDSGALPEDIIEMLEAHRSKRQFIQLIRQEFGSYADRQLIYSAYDYHSGLFSGINRKTGGSYMNSHLVPVAVIMIKIVGSHDAEDVVGAIGHDSIEDIKYVDFELFSKMFTYRSAYKVQGVTKPELNGINKKSIEYSEKTIQVIRQHGLECVILKNDADRTHNMLTLGGTSDEKRHKIWETERFYLPLGSEFGLECAELRRAIKFQREILHIEGDLDGHFI